MQIFEVIKEGKQQKDTRVRANKIKWDLMLANFVLLLF